MALPSGEEMWMYIRTNTVGDTHANAPDYHALHYVRLVSVNFDELLGTEHNCGKHEYFELFK